MVDLLMIDHVGHRGDGVASVDGQSIFVPYALPGERVAVERVADHPDRRRLIHIEQPSPDRLEPFCRHFGICGGCAIQHWRDESYREWKRSIVVGSLRQAGIDGAVAPIVDAHGDGRRRITVHARIGAHAVQRVGFAAALSHEIIPIDYCPILARPLSNALVVAEALANLLHPVGKPLDIQLTATNNGMDVDFRGSGTLAPGTIAALARLADQFQLARLTRHGELLVQRASPVINIGKSEVILPPGSFLQATAAGEAVVFEARPPGYRQPDRYARAPGGPRVHRAWNHRSEHRAV